MIVHGNIFWPYNIQKGQTMNSKMQTPSHKGSVSFTLLNTTYMGHKCFIYCIKDVIKGQKPVEMVLQTK